MPWRVDRPGASASRSGNGPGACWPPPAPGAPRPAIRRRTRRPPPGPVISTGPAGIRLGNPLRPARPGHRTRPRPWCRAGCRRSRAGPGGCSSWPPWSTCSTGARGASPRWWWRAWARHRAGLPMLAATWCTLVGAVIVLAGTIPLVTVRVRAEYPSLVSQVRHTIRQLQTWLAGPPLHLKTAKLQKLGKQITTYLSQHKTVVAGTVVTGGEIVVEILAGVVLMLFVTFFLLKDGERIWSWLLRAAGRSPAGRADHAGRAAWLAVVYYMRGTVLVAATHAVVIAVTLSIGGVPRGPFP